ncbi:hypothetical protein [Brachybacterium sp. GCM10030252]|uniref:hypothetical protein n=1 Tax=Brachybacterium sp. GCM10030252 TaxID=3273380 RepID=UPI003618684A
MRRTTRPLSDEQEYPLNLFRNPFVVVLLFIALVGLVIAATLTGLLVWWLTHGRSRAPEQDAATEHPPPDPTASTR